MSKEYHHHPPPNLGCCRKQAQRCSGSQLIIRYQLQPQPIRLHPGPIEKRFPDHRQHTCCWRLCHSAGTVGTSRFRFWHKLEVGKEVERGTFDSVNILLESTGSSLEQYTQRARESPHSTSCSYISLQLSSPALKGTEHTQGCLPQRCWKLTLNRYILGGGHAAMPRTAPQTRQGGTLQSSLPGETEIYRQAKWM